MNWKTIAILIGVSAVLLSGIKIETPLGGSSEVHPVIPDLQYWKAKADSGEPAAQFILGDKYLKGKEVPQDYVLAAILIQKAAEQGHAKAQGVLADMYKNGIGVPKDNSKYEYWDSKAQATARAEFNADMDYNKKLSIKP